MSRPAQQSDLFAADVEDTLVPMGTIPKTERQAREHELLSAAYDAAAILAMGDGGIGAETVARLRGELLSAVRELARRWQVET